MKEKNNNVHESYFLKKLQFTLNTTEQFSKSRSWKLKK